MKKGILGILVCIIFFGASVLPSIASFDKEVEVDVYNTLIKQAFESEVVSKNSWWELAKLLASDGATDDEFGYSVSIDGDYAIIGANNDDDNGADSGSAYIFTRSGSSWTQQAKLLPLDGATSDYFGWSVSIDGNYALVGAVLDDDNGDNSGSAYIYVRSGSNWTQQAKLLASDGATNDKFGYSVSIDGYTALVGAVADDNYKGSAYVFTRSGTIWSQQKKLVPSDGVNDKFGWSVSIDGNYALIGAPDDDNYGGSSGSAYIYVRSCSSWTQQAHLFASDAAFGDNFGVSGSLDGTYAIIGSPFNNDNGDDSGSAYIFIRSGSSWTQQAKLLASDGAADDWFGWSVSIDSDSAIIGNTYDDDNGGNSGSAYIFIRSGSNWNQQAKLLASDGESSDVFGWSVSLKGDYAIIGAYRDDDNGQYSGSAYIFTSVNFPPYTPSNPTPYNGEIDVDIDQDLSWIGGDPNPADIVTYDVYFEADDSTPDILVSGNQSGISYDPGTMNSSTQYYWQIVAWDQYGESTIGPIWEFTTEVNFPPNKPYGPIPLDNDTNVGINTILYWRCSDPDGDPLTYDVYFEANDPTPDILMSDNQTEKKFNPGTLNLDTNYYWKIVAWDDRGALTEGPVWHFTTRMFNTKKVILLGLITNLYEYDNFYSFNANLLLWLDLNPFDIKFYTNNEELAILKDFETGIYEVDDLTIVAGPFNAALLS